MQTNASARQGRVRQGDATTNSPPNMAQRGCTLEALPGPGRNCKTLGRARALPAGVHRGGECIEARAHARGPLLTCAP
eukprot:8274021-Pyramimonas_sp.AAC.1